MSEDCTVAVVQKIVLGGKHGAFAVATSEAYEGSITFSLEPTVWQERDHPEPGEVVYLTNLRLKRAGWRAKKGRYWKPSDEQTEIRKEQAMLERMKTLIEKLRNKWFPAGDDLVWKKWVDYKRRETRDLIELLGSDVRDDFKRRAIFLLLVPSAEFNPIYWKEEVGKFYHKDFLETLTTDLLNYATDLIVEFSTALRPMHCDKPEHYSQGGRGFSVFWSVPDKYHDALSSYNYYILKLLTLLSDEQCERIFPLFSLNDISTFCNMEDASGYNPFQYLLYSKVDDRYKRRADVEMRQIVREELAGRRKPREEWENALKCYANAVKLQLYSKEFNYAIDILAEQIQFLVSKEHYGNQLIDTWKIGRIYQLLSSSAWKEIRYRVARFAVFGNKEEFRVWNDETLNAAKLMLDEFGADDQELAERLQAAIDEGERRAAEYQVKEVAAKQSEENILSQMR